jgi:hypothetical protein
MDRCFPLNNADLRPHIAGSPLMLLHQIDARNHNPIAIWVALPGTIAPGKHTVYGSPHSFIVSTYDFNSVTLFDIHLALLQGSMLRLWPLYVLTKASKELRATVK